MFQKTILKIRRKKKCENFDRRGFTLIEVIVSVGLLSLVLGALVSTVSASLRLSGTGNQKYIASKMAQEGIELFLSKKGNNYICIENNATTPCDAIPDAAYLGGGKDWRYDLYENTVGMKDLPPMPPFRVNSYEIDGDDPNSLLAGVHLASFNAAHYLCQDAVSSRFTYCGTPIKGNFTREIRVSPDPTPPASSIDSPFRVEVIVRWTSRTGTQQALTIENHVFNTKGRI